MNKLFNIRILVVLMVVLLGFGFASKAQITIDVKMDTNIMLIGDQTKLTIESSFPANFEVKFPIFSDTIIKGLEVLNISDFDTSMVDNNLKVKQEYLVTSFDTGWYEIPMLDFQITFPDKERVDTVQSRPVYFGVVTMPLDTANAMAITDIKAPLDAPLTFQEVWPAASIALGSILLILAIIYLLLKLTRKEAIFVKKEKPKEPAHIIAFRDLDILKDKKLWQQGKLKEYYSELTEIVRAYIENRYAIQALEMTTDEIIDAFRISGDLVKDLKDNLFDLLVKADFIKFAKGSALADENEASYRFVFDFVTKTKPVVILRDEDEKHQENEISEPIEN
ncbi:MAG: hypothetical protein JEZ09_12790 [Salinivirgaceae bacterium]|nr:hypothetical protein [Salinivirgaceae bacterium]